MSTFQTEVDALLKAIFDSIATVGTVELTGGASGRINSIEVDSVEVLESPEILAVGQVDLTGGAAGSVDGIEIDSIEIMSGAESFVDTLANLAILVAANITANTSSPDYNAVAVGDDIVITAAAGSGYGANGLAVVSSSTTVTTSDTNMAGGVAENSVPFNASLAQTAIDVAANINAHTSDPDYKATSAGDLIQIEAVDGDAADTFVVVSDATTITTDDVDMAAGTGTPSQKLSENPNPESRDRNLARSFAVEFLKGVKDTTLFSGSTLLNQFRNKLELHLSETINS